ncbi:hypothetical protein MKX01_012910 [Papaver californicum]|nr:hypothetical protein MKX01_012910 [Papaver californicum]
MEVENEEESNRILKEVFGHSSSESEENDDDIKIPNNNNPPLEWIKIKEINGLWLFKDFLSLQQQASLLSEIKNEGWFPEEEEEEEEVSQNQAMRFGDLPSWVIQLSNSIREAICFNQDGDDDDGGDEMGVLPSNLLWRELFFDQLIANAYQLGEGICAHIDLMGFEDGIAIISLESECVMHFMRLETELKAFDCIEKGEENEDRQLFITKIPVLLTPGSLIVMSGEARYCWKHEINRKPGFQVWGGQEICRQKRISVTLRKLCETK